MKFSKISSRINLKYNCLEIEPDRDTTCEKTRSRTRENGPRVARTPRASKHRWEIIFKALVPLYPHRFLSNKRCHGVKPRYVLSADTEMNRASVQRPINNPHLSHLCARELKGSRERTVLSPFLRAVFINICFYEWKVVRQTREAITDVDSSLS